MSGATHSPGPWELDAGGVRDARRCRVVGSLPARPEEMPEVRADMRLIAAAPDLLAACEDAAAFVAFVAYVMSFMELDWSPQPAETVGRLDERLAAAVAKARGSAS